MFDMHVHTSPDVVQRKCSDIELAERFKSAGFSGAVIKCHYADTAGRASLLNESYAVSGMKFYGGIVLNNSAGGLNHFAVEASGKMGGRYVWFPTMDAKHYMNHRKTDSSDGIYILDGNGSLKPEALKILETAKKFNMLVGTGHMSPDEGMSLVRANAENNIGCKMVLTHADNPADFYTAEQQTEAVNLGAVVEHSYFTVYYKRTPVELIAEQIRSVGTENVFLSSDLGQPSSPYPDEGLKQFRELILAQGFSESDTRLMFQETPAALLGIYF
ncbi:MAG: amidohydrolase [Synergistaceae bacterium]|nr:amidohydrolase [Synergistaceae bacterium]